MKKFGTAISGAIAAVAVLVQSGAIDLGALAVAFPKVAPVTALIGIVLATFGPPPKKAEKK